MTDSTQISFNPANVGAFGDLQAQGLTPLIHLSFATGLRDQLTGSATANGGTVDANGGRLRLQTGTDPAGSAIAYSLKPASYRPGQGLTVRFTPIWTAGAADSIQIWGLGNATDGYFFGFNGATFGIIHRKGGVDTFTAQTSWNGSKCTAATFYGEQAVSFEWNKTRGIPLMIKAPYLGHGNVTFWVLDPDKSSWVLCHTLKIANTSASPQVNNPCLQIYGQVLNAGNTTNLISYLTCAAVFMDGVREYLGPQFGADSTKNSITTETNILAIRNATTVNGVANRGLIRLRHLSIVQDNANGIATFRVKKGVTLGGSPSFAAVDGTTADSGVTITSANSTASYDVAGTTVTGGKTIFNSYCARNSSEAIDLTPFNIFIGPGETLVLSAACTASASLGVAANWQEDVQ